MRILFQGDSITDAHRSRVNPRQLGIGYANFVAEALKDRGLDFINLGIGGNETKDLLARLKSDFLDIKPDILVILIGINDVCHYKEREGGLDSDIFYTNYESLLKVVKEELNCKIIMLEPFLLDIPHRRPLRPDLDAKIGLVRGLARDYADSYIPLDGIFAKASVKEEPSFWSPDGVHPSEEGHKLIAEYLAEALTLFL